MSSNTKHKCEGCRNPLPKREYLKCMTCCSAYDLQCGNVSVKLFNSMEKKDAWKCPKCISKLPKMENVNTPVRAADELQFPDESKNVTKRPIPSCNADIILDESALENLDDKDMRHLCSEIKEMRTEIKWFREVMLLVEVNDTIKQQNARIDRLEARIDSLESRTNSDSSGQLKILEETICQLTQEIFERDQDSLGNDVEVMGLPEAKNENSLSTFLTVARKLSLEVDERDVVSAIRVENPQALVEGGAPPKPRPLVVRLARRALRDSILRAARVRRRVSTEGMNLPGNVRVFYVNERLTKQNRQLFSRAREIANRLKWKYVWTRDGKIFARREHGEPRYRIRNEADIKVVFGDDPVCPAS